MTMSRKLHIGGLEPKPGWEILNISGSEHVHHTCDASDLSRFPHSTFAEIYASHVVEHFDYANTLLATLTEWRRTMTPGGKLYISVPDMDILARLFLDASRFTGEQRFFIMRMMFGGHMDEHDYHLVGLNFDFLHSFLITAGFQSLERVEEFNMFDDTSSLRFDGQLISLNVVAVNPP